ncbi:FAD4L1, partial [Symbiodinium sp. CCMP2592]
ELHLHQHAHRQQVLQVGVDPVTHANMQSEATSAIMNARAETAAVFGEAEAVIQSLRSENQQLGAQTAAIQGESYAAIQALRSENQQLGSRASVIQGEAETVIGNLRTENQQLGEMNRELNQRLEKQAKMILEQQELSKAMHQQLIALQSHVQAAEPKNPSIPSSAIPASSTQNGADQAASAFNALQALAGEVGGTMRRIEQAIEATVRAIAPSVALPIPAKASGSSGFVAPSPVEFGVPPYQCSRKNIFTGRLHSATPAHPPPPPHSAPQKLKPQVFDIADEDDFDEHGEDEDDEGGEDFEDDPIVPVAAHEPEDDRDYESSIYKYKDLKDIKLPQIPGSSVEFRAYRNSVLTQIASIDCSGKAVLLKWLQKSLDPSGSIALTRSLQRDCEGLPRLDGWISACISDAKHLKGEWGLQAQSYLERCHASGTMPSGRALLSILSRRYRIDKVRGPLVTLQSLFDLEPDSFSYQSLVAFKQRVEYVLNGLPERQWPDAETMFSWIYSRLKGCRMLSRTIDRVKDAKPGSKRRTFEYIWNGLEEVLAEVREDRNEQALKDSLKEDSKQKQKPDANAKGILTDMFSDHIRSTKPLQFETGNGVTSSGEGSGADDEGDEDAPTKAQRLITEAQTRYARCDDELDPVDEFGQRIAADFIIVHKECSRALHIAAGFQLHSGLWVHTVRYAAHTINLFHPAVGIEGSRYVNAVGSEFGGMKLQLGQLVYYRLDPAYREKFQASAAPGVFAGWRFDSGPSSFREVYHVLDYGKLKNREPGYEKAISVPREEIHVPRGNPILPMFTAAEAALSSFTKAEYEAIEFLDVPFSTVAPSTPVAKRHEYITLDRLMRLGATPGCKACKFDGTVHTPVCKARFDGLIKAEKIAASKSVRDAAPPDVERPDPSAESAPAAPEGDEDAPERASSSAGPRAPAGVVVQSSENKVSTGEFGLSARFLANERARNNTRRVKELPGENVLIEYGCEDAITIASNSRRVLEHFAKVSTKESSEINATSIEAYEFADLVIQSLFPQRYFKSVPNLGKASALITKNLSRREWQAEPKALEAIAQEAEGLRRNGTWDDTTAMPLHELRSQERFGAQARIVVRLRKSLYGGKESQEFPSNWFFEYKITGTTPDKLRRVNTPCIAESSMTDEDISAQGELHDSASRILMRCLWLARLCRADIAFAVTRLASRVTRWTAWEDRQVLRLVSYIHHTRDVCMNASCSWDAAPELRVYTDADFAACPYTSRSTSGIVVHIGTGQHAFPVMWQSRKQTSVARSTPEAEMISMASAMFSEVINLQTFLQSAFKSTVPIIFFQDNETVLAILKSGYSPKLRHLGRVHRVNVASMAEIFEQEEFSATYVNSKEQLANGLTKIIPPAEWSDMLTQLCLHEGVPHSATVSKVVAEEAERFASSLPRKITQEDLVQLLSYLPGESAVRPSASEAMCFTTGAFAHGGEKGEILKWPAIFDPRRLPVDSQLKLRELGADRPDERDFVKKEQSVRNEKQIDKEVLLSGGLLRVASLLGPLSWQASCCCLLALVLGVEFADFGTGVYHFSVDNYGSAETPIVGSQIEAFQGHHEEPWTITYRDFCNNCFPTCLATMPFLIAFEVFCSQPYVLLWAVVACAGIAFCQEFHKWSHTLRSQCHPVVNWLQDVGILVHRKAHLRHHKAPYETNYCIVTGHMNPLLDRRDAAVRVGFRLLIGFGASEVRFSVEFRGQGLSLPKPEEPYSAYPQAP